MSSSLKILVTGASGFIGSEVARRLEVSGHQVARLSLQTWRYMILDSGAGYDAVVHCAWAGVRAADRDNEPLQAENVEMFKCLLGHFMEKPPEVFITFGSQAEIYHQPSAYAAAKQECLNHLQELSRLWPQRRWLWLQLFSVYGEHESDGWLIPAMTKKLFRNESIDLTPGEQEMDYLHVRDVASAVLAGINSSAHGVYEVGSGQSVRVKDLVQVLHGLTGSGSKLNFGALPYRPGQIMRARANPNEFNADTGWSPTVDLKDGLRRVVQHIKNRDF